MLRDWENVAAHAVDAARERPKKELAISTLAGFEPTPPKGIDLRHS